MLMLAFAPVAADLPGGGSDEPALANPPELATLPTTPVTKAQIEEIAAWVYNARAKRNFGKAALPSLDIALTPLADLQFRDVEVLAPIPSDPRILVKTAEKVLGVKSNKVIVKSHRSKYYAVRIGRATPIEFERASSERAMRVSKGKVRYGIDEHIWLEMRKGQDYVCTDLSGKRVTFYVVDSDAK